MTAGPVDNAADDEELERRFAWCVRADDALGAGRPAEALAALTRYFRAPVPRRAGYGRLVCASVMTRLRRYADAEVALAPLLRSERPLVKSAVLVEHAKLCMRRGQLASAEQAYRASCELEPDRTTPRILLGGCLALQGRLAEAEAAHRAATALDGHPEEAWLNVGLVLRAQERFSEAAEAFAKALALDPDYVPAAYALNDARRAVMIASAVPRDGGTPSADARQRARAAWWAHDQAQALAWLAHGAAARSARGDLFRARVLAGLRRFDEARAELERALACATGARRGRVYAAWGRLGMWQRDFAGAEAWYRKRMWLEPGRDALAYPVARALVVQGRLEEAIAMFEQAARDARMASRAWFAIARAQRNLGRYGRAMAALGRVEALEPGLRVVGRMRADLACAIDIARGGGGQGATRRGSS